MNTDINTDKLLGASQEMVFVSILIMGGFLASAVGTGSISDMLVIIFVRLVLNLYTNNVIKSTLEQYESFPFRIP